MTNGTIAAIVLGVILALVVAAFALAPLAIFIMRLYIVPELVKRGKFFATPQSGSMRYIVKGEKLEKLLYDHKEFYYNEDTGKLTKRLPGSPKVPDSFFQKHFGAEWIGIPPVQVLAWNQIRSRNIKPGDVIENEGESKNPDGSTIKIVKDTTIVHKKEHVNTLYCRQVLADAFQLRIKDSSGAILVTTFTITLFDPLLPVIDLKGDWYTAIYGAIDDLLEAFVKDYTNETWKEGRKRKEGEDGPEHIETLVALREAFERPAFIALVERVSGFTISNFTFQSSDPTDKKLQEANQADAIALQQGKALVTAATKKMEAREIEGEGEQRFLTKKGLGEQAYRTSVGLGDGAAVKALFDNTPKEVHREMLEVKKFEKIPLLRFLNDGSPMSTMVNVGDINGEDKPEKPEQPKKDPKDPPITPPEEKK